MFHWNKIKSRLLKLRQSVFNGIWNVLCDCVHLDGEPSHSISIKLQLNFVLWFQEDEKSAKKKAVAAGLSKDGSQQSEEALQAEEEVRLSFNTNL